MMTFEQAFGGLIKPGTTAEELLDWPPDVFAVCSWLNIPGIGPFVAAGPVMTALSGAAVGAAVGGLGGCLVGLGLPEYEAKLYAGKVTEGNMLIVVHCDDDPARQSLARSVLEAVKAHDISTTNPVPVPS